MSYSQLRAAADVPVLDLDARLSNLQNMIALFLIEYAKYPASLSTNMALLLARMSAHAPELPYNSLARYGFHGEVRTYTKDMMANRGYLSLTGSGHNSRRMLSLTARGLDIGSKIAVHVAYIEQYVGDTLSPLGYKRAFEFLEPSFYDPGVDLLARVANMQAMVLEYIERVSGYRFLRLSHLLPLARIVSRNISAYTSDLSKLGYYFGKSQGSVVRSLAKDGYISYVREESNRRKRPFMLTERGRQVGRQLGDILHVVESNVGDVFDAAAYKRACDFLGNTYHGSITSLREQKSVAR